MAVVSNFLPSSGTLSIFGDNLDNNVAVSRNAAGTILVNGGAVPVQGGTPTVANTSLIQAFGLGGNDTITLSEVNGALPRANLFGGSGDDVLTGGSGGDLLFGQADDDTLLGKGGSDFLFGGEGNDVLTGGDADDQVFGEAGDDRLIWNPGDDSDLFEGGAGIDTAEVNGGNGAEAFTLTANGARVRFDRLDPAPFALDLGTTEKIVVAMNGGDDSFSATGNLVAALIGVTVDGGTGDDTILGSNGVDLLLGGADDDFVDGQQGDDVLLLGAGDDVAQWDPGDGSDVVEGQAGTDTLLFNGSGSNEAMDIAANGGRVRFSRDVANITMDLDDVETIQVKTFGGADTIVIGDLSGTDVSAVSINLSGAGATGDGAADSVTAGGTNGADAIEVDAVAGAISVTGLQAAVRITQAEAGLDRLTVNGLGDDDLIDASRLDAGTIALSVNGGLGADVILGSAGGDHIDGGGGKDTVSYAASSAGVTIDLAAGTASGGDAQGDGLAGIENLTGSQHVDALTGTGGANLLNGLGGADRMSGAAGDDTYVVDSAGDQVLEAAGAGADRINASVSYVLAAGQHVETLGTTSVAGTGAINLTGNGLDQTIFGNAGDNVLNGAGGADTLQGFGGNDTYVVDAAGDQVFEAAGGGGDRVNASASYALAANQQIEILGTTSVAGAGAINLTGNEFAQTLFGNAGANFLNGAGGADTLTGFGGSDTFSFTTAISRSAVDHITDFSVAADTIRLGQPIFSELDTGTLAASAFKEVGDPGATVDADDRILYDGDTGVLFYDANGSGVGGRTLFAVLGTTPADLSHADFVVVA